MYLSLVQMLSRVSISPEFTVILYQYHPQVRNSFLKKHYLFPSFSPVTQIVSGEILFFMV